MIYFIINKLLIFENGMKAYYYKELKIASIVILFLSIIIFEVAYRKDSGRIAINWNWGISSCYTYINNMDSYK